MDNVPPEILYLVCSRLDHTDDILNFRLVNRLFADIGAAYMLPYVTFYMHREDLARLEAISLHPIFSKHVQELVYFAITLDPIKVSWRQFVQNYKGMARWNGALRKLNLTPTQLMAAYAKYSDAVDEQDELVRREEDADLLKRVLPRFPRLEALTLTTTTTGGFFNYGDYRSRRALADYIDTYLHGAHPEGKRPLNALLGANAHSPRALTTLRVNSVHWRFFKRSERELTRMFQPFANLTLFEISISVGSADERVHEGDSLRKCQRVLAKGALRNILKSMPQLESLSVDILGLEYTTGPDRGASLSDIIQPNFHWPKLTELLLSGFKGDRAEIMNILLLHKDGLQKLCLRDIALPSTSWSKLLPDIRKHLCLEEACICGDIYGESEDEADAQYSSWDDPLATGSEQYWDLSMPLLGPHDMRESINMYCRQGGQNYPDELPLSELVVDKYYHEYVQPFFENYDSDVDHEDDDDSGFGTWEGGNDEWEDVSDEEFGVNDDDDGSDSDTRSELFDPFLGHALLQVILGNMMPEDILEASTGMDFYGGNDGVDIPNESNEHNDIDP
ncbi:hypothetical protein F5X98DRAFT_334358 [Xylaria grammica]|nr:hypothetical protein F5X98DRAFT_334358 [Xylaria grammica]